MAKPKTAAPGPVSAGAPDVIAPPPGPADAALAQTIPDVVDVPAPPESDAGGADPQPDLVKARVLAASTYGQPNDVIEIDAALAQTIPDVVDISPEAVAYAESLAGQQ